MQEGNTSEKKGRIFGKIWFVLIVLLPTLFSVLFFYLVYNNINFSSDKVYDIKLFDIEGKKIAEERNFIVNAEKDGAISLFFPITENLSVKADIPDFIDRTKGLVATVDYMNAQNEYSFYFSIYDMVGYCVFNGESYKLADSDTQKILSSPFSESLYENAEIPQLYTISGEPIIPHTVWWTYAMVSGDYAIAKDITTTSDSVVYDMSGALGLSFDKLPNECNIVISKDEKVIYDGGYENISQLSFEKGDVFHLNVTAGWSYNKAVDYYGYITYSFDVTISDRAEFYLAEDSYAVNSFCTIFCYNVKDASKIVFESTPSLPVKPEFTVSHGTAIALLPIVKETQAGQYKITLTYGAATEIFTVNITKDIPRSYIECSIDKFTVRKAFESSVENEMNDLKRFVRDNSNGEKMFQGEFLDYTELGAYKHSNFGDVYNNPNGAYISEGIEYRFKSQTDASVPALNSGRIIKTGYNDYLGNYVIVAHGCGLATWYAHLSNIDVSQGSYVVKGESLGRIGRSGLSSSENVAVFVSLSENFLSPTYLCGKQFDGVLN